MTYKTRGIIIKRTNINEADRILTILTKDHGKIRIIAKGIRRTLSKLAGNLELFSLGNYILAEGRNLDIITDAQMTKSFQAMRKNLSKTQQAFYYAEIIEKKLPEKEQHTDVFELFKELLSELNKSDNPLLLPYFELKFLSITGFSPELYKCLGCGEKIKMGSNSFDFSSGGISCQNCVTAFKISDDSVKLLRIILEHNFSYLQKIKISPKLIKELKNISDRYLKTIHQEIFKSERFVK